MEIYCHHNIPSKYRYTSISHPVHNRHQLLYYTCNICYHDSWSLSDHYLFHHVRFYSVGVIIRTVEIQCMESLELWGYSSFTLSNLRITISVVENLFHYHSKSALYHWPCLHHIKTTDIFMSFNTHILHLHSFSSLSYRLSVIHYHYFYR